MLSKTKQIGLESTYELKEVERYPRKILRFYYAKNTTIMSILWKSEKRTAYLDAYFRAN